MDGPATDPCELLGVGPEATAAEVNSAFRKASLKCHPDRCPGDPAAAERFRQLTLARNLLLTMAGQGGRGAEASAPAAYASPRRQYSRGPQSPARRAAASSAQVNSSNRRRREDMPRQSNRKPVARAKASREKPQKRAVQIKARAKELEKEKRRRMKEQEKKVRQKIIERQRREKQKDRERALKERDKERQRRQREKLRELREKAKEKDRLLRERQQQRLVKAEKQCPAKRPRWRTDELAEEELSEEVEQIDDDDGTAEGEAVGLDEDDAEGEEEEPEGNEEEEEEEEEEPVQTVEPVELEEEEEEAEEVAEVDEPVLVIDEAEEEEEEEEEEAGEQGEDEVEVEEASGPQGEDEQPKEEEPELCKVGPDMRGGPQAQSLLARVPDTSPRPKWRQSLLPRAQLRRHGTNNGSLPRRLVAVLLRQSPEPKKVPLAARHMLASMVSSLGQRAFEVPRKASIPWHAYEARALAMAAEALTDVRASASSATAAAVEEAAAAASDSAAADRLAAAVTTAQRELDAHRAHVEKSSDILAGRRNAVSEAKAAEKEAAAENSQVALRVSAASGEKQRAERALRTFGQLEASSSTRRPSDTTRMLKDVEAHLGLIGAERTLMPSALRRVLPALRLEPERRQKFDEAAINAAEGCFTEHMQERTEHLAALRRELDAAQETVRRAKSAVAASTGRCQEASRELLASKEALSRCSATLDAAHLAVLRRQERVEALAAAAAEREAELAEVDSLRSALDRVLADAAAALPAFRRTAGPAAAAA